MTQERYCVNTVSNTAAWLLRRLTACFLEKSSRSMTPQYLSDSDNGSFLLLLLLCCTVSSSRSFFGRFTVLLSRRVAIDDGVDMGTDDVVVVRYDEVTCVTAGGGGLTTVVVSAFLFSPFFTCNTTPAIQRHASHTTSRQPHNVTPATQRHASHTTSHQSYNVIQLLHHLSASEHHGWQYSQTLLARTRITQTLGLRGQFIWPRWHGLG